MNSIAWTDLDRTMASVPRTRGYRFALLERSEVAALTDSLGAWFPEISVGTASCFLREEFLHNAVHFRDGPERDLLVVLAKTGREIAGMFSCERDRSALSLYARLGVVAPAHRGRGLIHSFVWLAEAIGRAAGIEMIYGMATLKIPHVQRTFEKRRWRLIGITPGYDREMVAPGVV